MYVVRSSFQCNKSMMKFLIIVAFFILNVENIKSNEFGSEMESVSDILDYCFSETFQPQCSSGEVILMKSAIYGRMRVGRCITQREVDELSSGSKSIGCSTDALDFMDRKCTGKTECSIRIFDVSLNTTRPCFPDFLILYLETSYECVKVADHTRSCTVDVSTTPIHINDWKACGTMSQPWTVVAPIGQRIIVNKILVQITLPIAGKVSQKCSSNLIIFDKVAKINITECTSGLQREEQIYSSTGNLIDVYLKFSNLGIEREKLILKVQAFGCSDIIPPTDAYFKRQGETIVVGCYTSRKSWHLYCENGKWIGVIGNCSQGMWTNSFELSPEHPQKLETMNSKQVLWIVAIVGLTVALSLAVICFGTVFLKRKRFLSDQKRDYKTLNHQINPFAHQLTLTQTENGAVFMPVVNDTQCTPSRQPTYSVFVGEDDFKEVTDPTSGAHS